MTTISIKSNVDQVRKELRNIKQNQIPFATSLTINNLAFSVKKDIDQQLLTKLDRPTRFTTRSIEVKKSDKRNLTATVKVKDNFKQDQILKHLFQGKIRRGKSLEGALVSMGVLPKGKYIVPGKYAPLDSFGNIKRTFLNQLIAALKNLNSGESTLPPGVWIRKFDRAAKKKRKAQGKEGSFEFFIVHKQISSSSSGRRGDKQNRPEAVLLFVDQPKYRRLFNMDDTAKGVIVRDLEKEFDKSYQFALRTAK